MGTLSKLAPRRINVDAVTEGRWMGLGLIDEGPDVEVLIKGFTDEYEDKRSLRQKEAARGFGGDVDKLGRKIVRGINTSLLCAHLLLGVRNMHHDAAPEAIAAAKESGEPEPKGREYTLEEFKDFIRDPQWGEVADAVFNAARLVAKYDDEAAKEAAPSSEAPSITS